jgi:hypothetical protein
MINPRVNFCILDLLGCLGFVDFPYLGFGELGGFVLALKEVYGMYMCFILSILMKFPAVQNLCNFPI